MTEEQIDGHEDVSAGEEPAEGDAVAELAAQAPGESADAPTEAVTTGVQVVDDVLGTLERLDESSVEEHLPIFEAAHEQLRGALDGAEDLETDQGSGPQPD